MRYSRMVCCAFALWFAIDRKTVQAQPGDKPPSPPRVAPTQASIVGMPTVRYEWTGTAHATVDWEYSSADNWFHVGRWTHSYHLRLVEEPLVNLDSRWNLDAKELRYAMHASQFHFSKGNQNSPDCITSVFGTSQGRLTGDLLDKATPDEKWKNGHVKNRRVHGNILWESGRSLWESGRSGYFYWIDFDLDSKDWSQSERTSLFNGMTVFDTYSRFSKNELPGWYPSDHGRRFGMSGLVDPDRPTADLFGSRTDTLVDESGSGHWTWSWHFKRSPIDKPDYDCTFRQGAGTGGQAAEDFVDFLVGPKQQPIFVEITTDPKDATVEWTLTPVGGESGTVAPGTGTTKNFSFTPNVAGVRPTSGSRSSNRPVAYTLQVTVKAGGKTKTGTEIIKQDTISIIRQEYVDFNLKPPARALVGESMSTANFSGRLFATSNYGALVVNGGMQNLAQNTQNAYQGGAITINSAYRNPRRNKDAKGADQSVHMSGGAVDLKTNPRDVVHMVQLLRAAFNSGAANIFLERADGTQGGSYMFPTNWNPPPATYAFGAGNARVNVEDSDGDDLPDRVARIVFSKPAQGPPTSAGAASPAAVPSNMLHSTTEFKYAGGGKISNPNFRFRDTNGNKVVDVGEPLEFHHPLDGVNWNMLSDCVKKATHVHVDTGAVVPNL